MTPRTDLPTLKYEKDLWQSGFSHIAGFDEAGRGALAGPVTVAAVILPPNPRLTWTLAGVRDSKQMTPLQRETWAARIKSVALAWRVEFASVDEIDQLGIARGTRLAAARVLENLIILPEYLLLDFRLSLPESPLPQTALVKGDQLSLSIAAASVLAKTTRDALMRALDAQYPGYGLGKNKGYGTQTHRSALMRLGYSTVHRKSFVIKELRST
ncbi:MAG: ribonuclease HII [Anaerolineales bacterium]|jgi:ribonuclease HII